MEGRTADGVPWTCDTPESGFYKFRAAFLFHSDALTRSKNNIILADRVNLAIFALDYTLKIYTD